MLPSLLVFSYQIHKRSIDKIDTTEIQLMELNSFKEVANNIGEGCGNVPIVLVRCTVGDMLYKSSINKSIPTIPRWSVNNEVHVFKSLLTIPSNVWPLQLKQTFPPIIWIFIEGEGDGIESRLYFKIFSTLRIYLLDATIFFSLCPTFWTKWKETHTKIEFPRNNFLSKNQSG